MPRIGAKIRNLFLATLPLFFFSFSFQAFAQLTKINVGYVGINSDNVIAFVAKETGIFAKNGLDVQLIYFAGGTTAVMGHPARRTVEGGGYQAMR